MAVGPADGVTSGVRDVVEAVRQYILVEGRSPTVREVGRMCGWTSSHTAAYHMRMAAALGLLVRKPDSTRNYTLPATPGRCPTCRQPIAEEPSRD